MARLIYLPAGKGAKKQGVDDYLASGHTVDELLEHATSDLKSPPHDEAPAAYRAPLGESDLSIHLAGPTGEGKSELAALFQQHYGAELDARSLLSWESTENAIEGQAFTLKDQLLVLDDFAPPGPPTISSGGTRKRIGF